MKQIANRLTQLDILRGIAIFFVVFGHIIHIPELRNYIWGFHIPIFFFISGFLFNPVKYSNFIDFFKSKVKNLAIPYFFFYLITLCYYILIESHVRGGISSIKLLIGMFYGSYYNNFMYFNGALWFLPCLFSMEILGYLLKFINKQSFKIIFPILIYCIGIILIQNKIIWLPWGLNAAFCGLVYYCCGFYFKDAFKALKTKTIFIISLIIICIVLQVGLFPFPHADLASCKIENYYLYIPISMIGIILYLCLSYLIKKNRILEYLGINSLVIFVFQEPVYRVVIFVFSKLLKTEVEILRNSIVWCITMAIVSVLIITPLIYIYNKWINPQLKRIKL